MRCGCASTRRQPLQRPPRMEDYTLRDAAPREAPAIVEMIHRLAIDMANYYGGHAAATDPEAWRSLGTAIAEEIDRGDAQYAVAEAATGEWLGMAGAEITTLKGAYAPRRILQIRA